MQSKDMVINMSEEEKTNAVPLSDDELGEISGGKIEEIISNGECFYFVSVPIINVAELYDSREEAEAAQKDAERVIQKMYLKFIRDHDRLPTAYEFWDYLIECFP